MTTMQAAALTIYHGHRGQDPNVGGPPLESQLATNVMRQQNVISMLKHYQRLLLRLRAERDELLAIGQYERALASGAASGIRRRDQRVAAATKDDVIARLLA